MNILIYGATGYIGNKLSEYLLTLGYKVGNVSRRDSLLTGIFNYNFDDDIHNVINHFLPDKIIYMSASFDNNNVSDIIDINVKKPLAILNALQSEAVIEFIYIGSYWQFGDAGCPNVPIDLYSASKRSMRAFFDYYNEYTQVVCKEIVLYGTYGESDGRGKLLDYLISSVNEDKVINLTEGYQLLNLSYVGDICKEIEKLFLENNGLNFLIKSDRNYSPRDIVMNMRKIANVKVNFGAIPYRTVELMNPVSVEGYECRIIPDSLPQYIENKFRLIKKNKEK